VDRDSSEDFLSRQLTAADGAAEGRFGQTLNPSSRFGYAKPLPFVIHKLVDRQRFTPSR
jgi:hypothetical protein